MLVERAREREDGARIELVRLELDRRQERVRARRERVEDGEAATRAEETVGEVEGLQLGPAAGGRERGQELAGRRRDALPTCREGKRRTHEGRLCAMALEPFSVAVLSCRSSVTRPGLARRAVTMASMPSMRMPFCGMRTSSSVVRAEKASANAADEPFSRRLRPASRAGRERGARRQDLILAVRDLLGILEERTGDHGAARRSHAVVVELEDLERGRIADELEPASVQERERGRRGGGGEGVSCGAAKQGRRRSMEETTHMGSALLPPKALSLRSSEVRLGRVRSEVHRARRHCGISEMRRPVKTSLKSAVCCTCTRARSA